MKKTNTKRALGMSLISLLACGIMFAGSTYAWFTDSVEVKGNKIETGTLKVDLEILNGDKFESLRDATAPVFGGVLWEPGYTDFAVLKVENEGDLAAKWELQIIKRAADTKKLAAVIDVYKKISKTELAAPTSLKDAVAQEYVKVGTLADVLLEKELLSGEFAPLSKGTSQYVGIVLHMQETAGNEYQGATDVEFDLNLNAYQLAAEKDGFGNDQYDALWSPASAYADTDLTDGLQISNANELALLAKEVNAGTTYKGVKVELTDNIDLRGYDWTPIGNSTYAFQGNFDGNGYTISDLVVTGYDNYVGLFGNTNSGKVENLTINNASLSGRLNLGAVSGHPYTTSFENINVTGTLKVEGMSYVGGVFGKNAYANINNVKVNVTEDSYVKAVSLEGGKAYRTYVGGLVGFMGEGSHKVSNVTTNVDVYGSTCDIGGLTGIAHYQNQFENITVNANVYNTHSTDVEALLEMGGIAGVWHNQNDTTVTMNNVEFNGELHSLVEFAAANGGLVGSKYSATGTGKLIINGKEVVLTVAGIKEALKSETYVALSQDVTGAATKGGYSKAGFTVAGQTLDGQGHTLTVTGAGATWDCGIYTNGGTIKNLTLNGSFRGIFTAGLSSDLVVENVVLDKVTYTFSADSNTRYDYSVTFKNSTLNGWTSYSDIFKSVSFENCKFGKSNGYAYCRPYNATTFTNCTFSVGYSFDSTKATSTLVNCYVGDTLITDANKVELLGSGASKLVINNK